MKENLIVQGCAGSGKTMILLHRLAYLKSNYNPDNDKVKIITPSENFNNHINELWSELGLKHIEKLSLTEYYCRLLTEFHPKWKKKLKSGELCVKPDSDLSEECLEYYYGGGFEQKIKENWAEYYSEYKKACEKAKKDFYEIIMPKYEMKKAKYESVSYLMKNSNPPKKPKLQYPIISVIEGCFAESGYNNRVNAGSVHQCELFASLMLIYKTLGKNRLNSLSNGIADIKYLFIDEAQDISKNEYLLIKSINGENVILNLFGDIRQNIKKYGGISDWKSLSDVSSFSEYELRENYRNTQEITEYANKVCKINMSPMGINGNCVLKIDIKEVPYYLKNENDKDRVALIVAGDFEIPPEIYSINHADNIYRIEEVKGIEYDTVYLFSKNATKNENYIAMTRALSKLYIISNDSIFDPI